MLYLILVGCQPPTDVPTPSIATVPTVVPSPDLDPCGMGLRRAFPEDGAVDRYLHPSFDEPSVEGGPGLTVEVVDADDTVIVSLEDYEDGRYTGSLPLAPNFLPDTTLRIVATDAEGCSQVASTFEIGPYRQLQDLSLYDGRGIVLQAPAERPGPWSSMERSLVVGWDVSGPWVLAPVDHGWSIHFLDSHNAATCREPIAQPDARFVNSILTIANLNGLALDSGGSVERFVDVTFRALVDPATGTWDRVAVTGQIDIEGTYQACEPILVDCVPCADTGRTTCLDLVDVEVTGAVASFNWVPPLPQYCGE